MKRNYLGVVMEQRESDGGSVVGGLRSNVEARSRKPEALLSKLSSLVTFALMTRIATIPSIMSFLRQFQGGPARLKIRVRDHFSFRPGPQRSKSTGKMIAID